MPHFTSYVHFKTLIGFALRVSRTKGYSFSQCPLCRKEPATDNDRIGFCEQCLALPDMIKSIQRRLNHLEDNCRPLPDNNTSPSDHSSPIVNLPGDCSDPSECDTIFDETTSSVPPLLPATANTKVCDSEATNSSISLAEQLLQQQLSDYREKHKQLFTVNHSSPGPEPIRNDEMATPNHSRLRSEPSDSLPSKHTQAYQTDTSNENASRTENRNDKQLFIPVNADRRSDSSDSLRTNTQACQTNAPYDQGQPTEDRGKTQHTKADILLIGDSMLKHIEPKKLSRRKAILRKSISGAKIDDAFEIAKDIIEKCQVSEMIVHLGTNNLTTDDNPTEIITKMSSFCDNLQQSFAGLRKITISTIIHRMNASPNLTWKTHRVNAELKLLANERGWKIIDNECIDPNSHIGVDGVHLNGYGVKVLAQNLIRHIRSTINAEEPPFRDRPDWHRRKKSPRDMVFPRDWMDSLQTANTLLGQNRRM